MPTLSLVAALAMSGCATVPAGKAPADPVLGDAHTHLSYRGESALTALHAAGVDLVRDCGGDVEQLKLWRDQIAAGQRIGPRIYLSGRVIDGPKPLAVFRITVTTPDEARRAVETLAGEGVDFIKTHNAVPREAYFAVLDAAKRRGLPVASHLPRGVGVHEAVEAGVGSIEHAAESLLASPIYAGTAKTVDEAMAWWDSPDGAAQIEFLAASGVSITPTLVAYEAFTELRRETPDYEPRRRVFDFLIQLTGRLHAAGVTLLAGSDFAGPDVPIAPGASLQRELELLRQAGLSESALAQVAGPNLEAWLTTRRAATSAAAAR